MAEYIDKSALYEKIAQLEELARNRYLETPSNSPCYSRYMAQLNERTAFKHIIADFHSADVAPVRRGRWLNFYGDFSTAECDICAEIYEVSPDEPCRKEFFDAFKEFYKFCPNCGAKMDGGAD